MKKYLITVKGMSYEVEVEELKGVSEQIKADIPFVPVVQAAQVVTKKPSPTSTDAGIVTSPMPGSIFKVLVKSGDTVKKGDTLIILEAMKMENEIFASVDGVVASVEVSEGATVNTGDVLVTF